MKKHLYRKNYQLQKNYRIQKKNTIIERARVALFLLNRETEPICLL